MAEATSWSYCHHTHPSSLLSFSLSVCLPHCPHSYTAWHTDAWAHTHIHITHTQPPSPRAVRAQLSSAPTSHLHSLSCFFFFFFTSLTPWASWGYIKERRHCKYWITWKPFTLLGCVTPWHAHTYCTPTHMDYGSIYFSQSNIYETSCWRSSVAACDCASACECARWTLTHLLPRDFSSGSCGLKNHFPIRTKPLSIKHLQQRKRAGEKENH